jgi:hypothetical protein
MIWEGKQPYSLSNPQIKALRLGPPTLIPVGTLLAELTEDQVAKNTACYFSTLSAVHTDLGVGDLVEER